MVSLWYQRNILNFLETFWNAPNLCKMIWNSLKLLAWLEKLGDAATCFEIHSFGTCLNALKCAGMFCNDLRMLDILSNVLKCYDAPGYSHTSRALNCVGMM